MCDTGETQCPRSHFPWFPSASSTQCHSPVACMGAGCCRLPSEEGLMFTERLERGVRVHLCVHICVSCRRVCARASAGVCTQGRSRAGAVHTPSGGGVRRGHLHFRVRLETAAVAVSVASCSLAGDGSVAWFWAPVSTPATWNHHCTCLSRLLWERGRGIAEPTGKVLEVPDTEINGRSNNPALVTPGPTGPGVRPPRGCRGLSGSPGPAPTSICHDPFTVWLWGGLYPSLDFYFSTC